MVGRQNVKLFLREPLALFYGKRLHAPDTEWLSRRKAPYEAKVSHIDRRENVGFQAAPGAVAPVGHPDPVLSIRGSLNHVVRVWRRLTMPLRVLKIDELGQLISQRADPHWP